MSDTDSDDDNNIRYGTPLEPYEEDEIPSKRKYEKTSEQYAVDEHGRRRFHGAFTGGFSAGFGNTVGSQEGWTPATFKSSRSDKAQSSVQRPEDFMDEEDRSEFGIAPKLMQTQSEFSGLKRSRKAYHDGTIPGVPILTELLRPVHETAAVKMLRSMGWRQGQGTGDRVTKAEKNKAKDQQKVYGCFMPKEIRENLQQTSDQDSSDSEYDYNTLFAPDDYEPYILARKDDRFGLGYQGLSRHSVLGNMMGEYGATSTSSHLLMKEKGKKVSIRGQAFGVGALEADDEDIYGTEDMSHYDYAIGGPPPETAKKQKEKTNNVLPGFVPARVGLPPVPSHPPPALPRDYTPAPAGGRRTRFDKTTAKPRDQGLGRHELTAEARGALLGEKQAKSTTMEEFLTQITSRTVNFQRKIDKIIDFTKPTTDTPEFISIKDSGKEITKVFKPFVGDPAKQKRYEDYLKNKTLERDAVNDNLSEWEREREMVEFEQAAKLYKPLTGVMGDRFTHAAAPDDATNPLTVVTKSNSNYGNATKEQMEAASRGVYGVMTRVTSPWRPEPLVYKRFNIPDPGGNRPESAKEDKPKVSYSVFSYIEESVHDKDSFAKEQTKFSGSKSLEKADKAPENTVKANDNTVNANDSPVKQTDNTVKANDVPVKQTDNHVNAETATQVEGNKRMTAAELFLKESEKSKEQGEEVTNTIEKFDKMDLYKSIFLSDSEEDVETGNLGGINIIDDFMDEPKNVERNDSPPRGIFANIDFDEINSWRRNTSSDKKKETSEKDEVGNKQMEVEVYGPKIPENIQKRIEAKESDNQVLNSKTPQIAPKTLETKESVNQVPDSKTLENKQKRIDSKEVQIVDSSSSSDSWVEAKVLDRKKKKSKHKKHKSKKKSKHKKKDR